MDNALSDLKKEISNSDLNALNKLQSRYGLPSTSDLFIWKLKKYLDQWQAVKIFPNQIQTEGINICGDNHIWEAYLFVFKEKNQFNPRKKN